MGAGLQELPNLRQSAAVLLAPVPLAGGPEAWAYQGNFMALNIVQLGNAVLIMWRQTLGTRLIMPTDIVSLAWASSEHIAGDLQVASGLFDNPEDIIFTSLQTDDRWTVDDIGYNVAIEIPPQAFPRPRLYEIETSLNLLTAAPIVSAFPIPVTHRPELVA